MGGRSFTFRDNGVETFCVSGCTLGITRRIVITFEEHTTIAVSHYHKKISCPRGVVFEKWGRNFENTLNVPFLFQSDFDHFHLINRALHWLHCAKNFSDRLISFRDIESQTPKKIRIIRIFGDEILFQLTDTVISAKCSAATT
jgi:hypothetical protein